MPDEVKIQEWREQYKAVYQVSAEGEDGQLEFYFRKPERVHLSRFAKAVTSDTLKALTQLIFDCLLWPDEARVRTLFEEKPGLIISLGSELQKLIGTNQDFFVKRL